MLARKVSLAGLLLASLACASTAEDVLVSTSTRDVVPEGPTPVVEKENLTSEDLAARKQADDGVVQGMTMDTDAKDDEAADEGTELVQLDAGEQAKAEAATEEGAEAKAFFKLGRSLGLANGRVVDGNFAASSAHGNNWFYYGPRNSRLGWTRNYGSWLPQYRRNGEWVQVDLDRPFEIGGIATQGSRHGHWIREYTITYSIDGTSWKSYSDSGTGQRTFQGNYNANSVVKHTFNRPILARFVRLNTVSYHSWPALRWELYATKNEQYEGGQPLGLSSGSINNSAFRASSAHGNNWHYYGPQHSRLFGGGPWGGWIPRYNRAGEWVQVDLGKVQEVGQIATQGRRGGPYWIKSYFLAYSRDGNTWRTYMEQGMRRTFDGNVHPDVVVKHQLHVPFLARYVRLIVNTFHNGWPVLRWELYAPEQAQFRLGKPLGISTGVIPDSALRASTAHGNNWNYYGPRNARLYGGHSYGCWLPRYNRNGEWIQVDLGSAKQVGGIATQGRKWGSYWVTSYHLLYSLDGSSWTYYMSQGARANLVGNNDYNSVRSHIFPAPFVARYVRLVVTGRHGWVCARFELYAPHAARLNAGKLENMGIAMGMKSGKIKDSQVKASSSFNMACAPQNGRVGGTRGAGAWCSRHNNADQWLQVETSGDFEIGGVATQGRAKWKQWVTSYTVTYSDDGNKWKKVLSKDKKSTQIFRGNLDSGSVVRQAFLRPFQAKYIRFHPMGWYGHISMRVEIYDTAARQAKIKAAREAAAKAAAKAAAARRAALLAKLAKEKAEREAKLKAEKLAKEKAEREKAEADHRARMAKTAEEKKAAKEAQAKAARDLARVEAENKALTAKINAAIAKDKAARDELAAKVKKANAQLEEEKFDEAQYKEVMKKIADLEELIAAERTKQLHAKVAWEEKVALNDINKRRVEQLKKRIDRINKRIADVKAKYSEEQAARKAEIKSATGGGDAKVTVSKSGSDSDSGSDDDGSSGSA